MQSVLKIVETIPQYHSLPNIEKRIGPAELKIVGNRITNKFLNDN